jgi:thiol-disulfide isomerase/thioredoxin
MLLPAVAGGLEADVPDVAVLVRRVQESEAWIDRVESFHLKATGVWETLPREIVRRREELQAQQPGEDVAQDPSLRPSMNHEVEIAFDSRRIYDRDRRVGQVEFLNVWDGTHYLNRTTAESPDGRPAHRSYTLRPTPLDSEGSPYIHPLTNLFNFRTAHHPFWWLPPRANEELRAHYPPPEAFAYVGCVDYEGTPCHLVCRWGQWDWLYIAVSDGRLRAMKSGAQSNTKPSIDDRLLAFYRREGRNFSTVEAMSTWFANLNAEEAAANDLRLSAHLPELTEPIFEWSLEDYREVSPGYWMPMTHTYTFWRLDDANRNAVATRNSIRISDVRVNEPLPDELFRVPIEEGARVYDAIHQPPLSYTQKARFTPEEWQAILDRAARQGVQNEAYETAQNRLIGQPAPAFPDKAIWMNGEPLTWETLKGKRVVLDFWAEWCVPCRGDYPALAAIYKNREENGLVIIGVHVPGSEPAAIRKVMDEFHLDYPTCIDVPADEAGGVGFGGQIYQALGVDRIPHAVLVDETGRIARTGEVQAILLEALRSRP